MLSWLYDKLVSLVTRCSQAQRILLNIDLLNYIISIFKENEPVDYKIHDPKILKEFQLCCQSKLSPETLSELQNGSSNCDALTDSVMSELEISPRYRHLVLDAVVQMCKFYSDIKIYEEKCNIPVTEDIQEHQQLLLNIWNTLVGRPVPSSFKHSKHEDHDSWGYLGFQMPLSDFRKTGLLGLLSLDYMASNYPELSKKTLSMSRNEDHWFPFALVSINVTSWVLDFYNENKLNAFSYNNEHNTLETFYILHSSFFFNFINFYMLKMPNSVLNFNQVASEYKVELRNKLSKLFGHSDKSDSLHGTNLVNHLKNELKNFNINAN